MKKVLLFVLILFTSYLSEGQAFTNVTATLTDISGQVWNNASVTASLIPSFGNPAVPLNQGNPITDNPQNTLTSGSGVFTLTLDDNSQISPSGSMWSFTICPNATVNRCDVITIRVSGTTLDLSSSISSRLTVPTVNAAPTIVRAYTDAEIRGGNGSLYWRTLDNTLRGCQSLPNNVCTWISIGSQGGGGGGGGGYGIDATTFVAANDCLKIQAAIYSLGPAGGIINATGFVGDEFNCNVNPFQAPSQASPVNFAGLPTNGLLLLPDINFYSDVPWYWPNKWTVIGVGGYGVNKTVIHPSATFTLNKVVSSATGGASGCSATAGGTVILTGTTITNPTNLIGMYLQCASNASGTAIPTPKNAMIGGVIIAESGNSPPYTLTLAGAGAAGTVSNTGWTINPVIMGWQPNSVVFGSNIDKITSSCTNAASVNINGCITFINTTANEHTSLTNFNALNFDYMGMGLFSSQSQNGGTFGSLTFNWSSTGNDNTIGIEIGGTGYNSSGGGGTGLCAFGNPCAGVANRGFTGVTMIGSGNGTNNGGIGFDINASNVKVDKSHCESLRVCGLVGDSAAVQAVELDQITGCSSSGCALSSVVDISTSYATGAAPAPTQNITVKNIQRSFSSTWDIRDFINLTGIINDPTLREYGLGTNGTNGRQVFTTSQQMSCITTGGILDTNGADCAPASQLQLISKISGTVYADSFNNNNGVADIGQQINNSLQWMAVKLGITNGVTVDATGFNRVSGYPVGIDFFTGTLGTTIPASGLIKFGAAKFFQSVQIHNPPNWIMQGNGGAGLGAGGASGTLFAPNIGNTVNANYANDTTVGTIAATSGSYTITGTGTGWTSGLVNHVFLACVTPPCTNQGAMVQGIVLAASGTSITLDVPAQATLAAGSGYTITPPLFSNQGVIRDIGFDGNSYVAGGLIGLIQNNGGSNSYIDNINFAHFNAGGFSSVGLNNGEFSRINVLGNGLGVSTWMCADIPQGLNISNLTCQEGGTTPTLSYGIYAAGSGFVLSKTLFQNVKTGIELATNPNYATNNITVLNSQSGSGGSAVTTLVDLGSIGGGSNGPAFQANLFGLQCPSGCTNAVVDSFNSYTLTDAILGFYQLSRTDGSGNRTLLTDSITTGVPNITVVGNVRAIKQYQFTTNIGISTGAGVPSAGSCTAANGGSIYLRTDGSTATTLYVCDNATHVWTAK